MYPNECKRCFRPKHWSASLPILPSRFAGLPAGRHGKVHSVEHASNAGQPGNPGRDGEVELHENDERDARVVVSHAQ